MQIAPENSTDTTAKPAVVVVQHAKKEKPRVKSTNLSHILMLDPNKSLMPTNIILGSHYEIDKPHLHRKYELNILQRIFIIVERADSCFLAYVLSLFFMALILLGVILYVLGNDPQFMYQPDDCHGHAVCDHEPLCPHSHVCPPHELKWMEELENIILYCFTFEYGVRFLICPIMPSRFLGLLDEDGEFEAHAKGEAVDEDEEYPVWKKVPMYLFQYKNLIDLATILPFYAMQGGANFNFIRALRLIRILHIFKLSKENEILHLLERTIKLSLPALGLVSFVGALLMILLGSILFFAEQGEFMVTAEYPNGEFMRWDLMHEVRERSPFRSLQISLYWMIQTCTNTGYGDLYPTSQMGRIVASITMCVGVVICGLPVGVLGSNFSHEYDLYHSKFREHAGLESSKDEDVFHHQQLLDHLSTHSGVNVAHSTGHGKTEAYRPDSESLPTQARDSDNIALAAGSLRQEQGSESEVEKLRSLVKTYQKLQENYACAMTDLTKKVDDISKQQIAVNAAISASLDRLGYLSPVEGPPRP